MFLKLRKEFSILFTPKLYLWLTCEQVQKIVSWLSLKTFPQMIFSPWSKWLAKKWSARSFWSLVPDRSKCEFWEIINGREDLFSQWKNTLKKVRKGTNYWKRNQLGRETQKSCNNTGVRWVNISMYFKRYKRCRTAKRTNYKSIYNFWEKCLRGNSP